MARPAFLYPIDARARHSLQRPAWSCRLKCTLGDSVFRCITAILMQVNRTNAAEYRLPLHREQAMMPLGRL